MGKGLWSIATLALFFCVMLRNSAQAHEKWLIPGPEVKRLAAEERPGPFRDFWPEIAIALGAAATLFAIAVAADRFLRRRRIGEAACRRLLEFRKAAPPMVGIGTGILLIACGATRSFLAPDLRLADVSPDAFATGLAAAQIVIGACFVVGLYTRLAAVALLVLWAPGAALFGFRAWIDYLDVAGFAVFLALCGRGAFSLDSLRGVAAPSPSSERTAVAALRLALGANLAILAINDKLANPLVSMKIVADYHLNFTRSFGPLAFPDDRFVLAAFAVELAVGFVVAAGVMTRLVSVVVFVLLTTTYFIFGLQELLGHLPIIAGGVALLLMGTGGKWRIATS
ncbi:MAG: hypothetical protein FD180_400 [Planctomycetota bacterium]|nr:MAG: hypothetical protein FD180_400 [Planctomycetota bacterium]